MKKVLIIGGGYAGLSCAIQLARQERFEITLLDKRSDFLNLMQLHRTHFLDLERLQVPYISIAEKWGFHFFQVEAGVAVSGAEVQVQLPESFPGLLSEFDFVVQASGAKTLLQGPSYDAGVDLEQLSKRALKDYLDPLFGATDRPSINVVGSGATGIQYLFEIEGYLKRNKREAGLRLISADDKILKSFPGAFHRFVLKRAKEKGIEISLSSPVQNIGPDSILIERENETKKIDSDLCLWFPGMQASPQIFKADVFGRVLIGSDVQDRFFTTGDCSLFEGKGMNLMTAQSAVRKGKLVADNIGALIAGKNLSKYNYQALGYFVSLGSWEGIGWMLTRLNVLKGFAALVVKEAIEAQFRLYLEGIDTYIG